jgi:hypothetical protein
MFYDFVRQRKAMLDRETGISEKGGHKLRTYRMYKDMYVVEEHGCHC